MRRIAFLLAVFTMLALPLVAQGPAADWRTVTTPHFRVHYPAPAEAWTLRAVARMEAIRERVAAEVGWTPAQVIDVIVQDPVAQPNGMALPLLDSPRMVLWTSPPGPDSAIGNYADWAEALIIHEDLHNVHLLQPSRNPLRRFAGKLLPLGPVTTKAPRWVHEGYATLVEGTLTARGRPNGDIRAAILRRRAQAGRLPSYGQMSNDGQSFLGPSMAYLVGSAYLEWLVERTGPDSPRHLWARLTARTDRSFEQAFAGVFGDTPARLYGRFVAELTWRAMEVERRLEIVRHDGELWQDLAWATGEPAVSPDGSRIALVRRSREAASRIVVWSTEPDAEAEKKWQQRVDRMLARDPQDVPPVRNRPPGRKALFELCTRNGAEPSSLRFMPDGKGLLYVRFEPDGEGFLHPDLFLWSFEEGTVRRLTTLADVRAADPSPDGAWAVGVRNRHGLSQLVRVEIETGALTELSPPSVEEVWAWPRVSPDGASLAAMCHREGRWRVLVRSLSDGAEREVATPAGALVAHLAWLPDGGSLLATFGQDGLVNIARLSLASEVVPQLVTRSAAACLAPAPTPDGRVFFLALEHDGLDLRVTPLDLASALPADVAESSLAPAVRPVPPPVPEPFRLDPIAPGSPYGFGRHELRVLAGGLTSASGRSLELGLRVGDVVGRLSSLIAGAAGRNGGASGGALATTWRGWPVEVGLHAFSVETRPSEQGDPPPGIGESLDARRTGVAARMGWNHVWRASRVGGELSLGTSRIDPEAGKAFDQRIASLSLTFEATPSRRPWRLWERVHARLESGSSDGRSWQRIGGELGVGVSHTHSGVAVSWRRHSVRGNPSRFDLMHVGGAAGSLLPAAFRGAEITVPALPVGVLIGEEYEGQRGSLLLAGLPLFFERHRMWSRGGPKSDWLRLAGLEVDLASEPMPLVKLPGLRLRLGAARVLDPPFEDTNRFWAVLAYRP